ncbi:MAG: PAS domain S-box protein [Syntrophobacteraceae bacterium]|nr:PAS domain S-box protein [Syntrophobacteraceae bacterium]
MNSFSKKKPAGAGSVSLRIAVTYFLIGAFWILFSDKTLSLFSLDPSLVTTVSIIKGWGFVSVTAVILYVMISRWTLRLEGSQEEVRASEAKYRTLVESANSIILRMDNLGNVTFINDFAQRFFGYAQEELVGKNVVGTIVPPVETGGRDLQRMIEDIGTSPDRYAQNSNENIRRNGERVWIAWTNTPLWDESGRSKEILCVGSDITERKQAEEERELVVEFLRLVNESGSTRELVRKATAFFQKSSGCEAAGIRLRLEDDYPYYETRGFSSEFVRLENSLCTRDRDGQRVLDTAGDPVLECMCANVICGRFDPLQPFFTANGSFWTNSTTELLAKTAEADRRARMRNRCNGEGYESVALIALRVGAERIGLLQLNDGRKGRFTLRTIESRERLCNYLAVALAKFLAKEELGESEQRYRELFEAGSDAIIFIDNDTEMILDANSSASVLFGYSREELLTKRNWELSAEPEATRARTRGAKAVLGRVITVPLRHLRRKDGMVFPAEITGRSFQWRNRFVFIAAIRDITERKKAEEEKSRLAAIVEFSADAIIGNTLEGTIISWNRGAQNIYQYLPREAIGRSVKLLAPEGLWGEVCANLEKVNSGELVEHYETVRRRKDGRNIEVSLTVSPILDGLGNIVGASSVSRDITSQKRVRDALRESEARMKSIFRAAPIGIGLTSDRVFLDANDQLCAIVGYSRDELIGRESGFLCPDDKEYECVGGRKYGQIEGEGRTGTVETRFRRKDGRIIDVVLSSTPIDPANHASGVTVTVMDITERKRSEQERARIEAQLRQAQKMEALGTLAGGIAHDFNNILGVISGFTELTMLDAQNQDNILENLREVLMASGRARDLVKQILAFSRQSGQEKRPVQVGLIVKEVLKMLRASLPATIEIKHAINSRAVVSADPTQIHQVLMNLCTNGAHAMFEAGGVLDVSLADLVLEPESIRSHSRLEPGPYVKLSIGDTGHGIDPSIMDRIFDPFFTTKGQGGGTGLGLAVVHGIAQSLGGCVDVESQIGRGTRFHVFLPALEMDPAAPRDESFPLPGGRERILVVDDEPALAGAMRRMLESLGYTVAVRESGKEALPALRTEDKPFDLVITDMTMPRMTGAELAGKILNLWPDQPIILCTGFSEKIDAEKAKVLGIRGFLMKPVQLKELADLVRKVLDTKGQEPV